MKKKILPGAAAICLCALLFSFRFDEATMFTIASVDRASGAIKARLQTNTAIKQRPRAKTTAVTYQIEGAKSPVRLGTKDSYFEVTGERLQLNNPSPVGYISFYKLSSGKQGRTLVIDTDSGSQGIAFNLSPVTSNSWHLVVGELLTAGEYAFVDKSTTTPEGNITVWTFGID